MFDNLKLENQFLIKKIEYATYELIGYVIRCYFCPNDSHNYILFDILYVYSQNTHFVSRNDLYPSISLMIRTSLHNNYDILCLKDVFLVYFSNTGLPPFLASLGQVSD